MPTDENNNQLDNSFDEYYGTSNTGNTYNLNEKGELSKISMRKSINSLKDILKSVFLPEGYPDSVSSDYTMYQIWDTFQAFCSSISGALAASALFESIGVGDDRATIYGATLTWLIKDGTGMLGQILFVWYKGTLLDSNSKMWRLFADVLNDCSFLVDILSPYFPYSTRIYVVSFSGVLKSIVGITGGSTRASLTQHQAIKNNMADVSAKDHSQETLVNLVALVFNLIIINYVKNNKFLVWELFIIFTIGHIIANYKAVKSITMKTFNQNRLHILLNEYFATDSILDPSEVNRREPVLRTVKRKCHLNFGCALNNLRRLSIGEMSQFLNDRYCLIMTKKNQASIILHKNSTDLDLLKALYQFELIEFASKNEKIGNYILRKAILDGDLERIETESTLLTNITFGLFTQRCKSLNWSLTSTQFSPNSYRYDFSKSL